MTKKILMIGLGLIGSSLALAIKKEHPEIIIYGWDKNKSSEAIAKEKGIIDEISQTWQTTAVEMDVIFLAIPVKAGIATLQELAQLPLKEQAIITDASSTKEEITKVAAELPITFIGGHPMAGSHKSGVLAANIDLFENAYYIFTPIEKNPMALASLQDLLKGTRAKFVELEADEHDQITGMLSHLPHIIAAGLVNQSDVFSQKYPRAKQLAAGGFRDITRIASSDPQMWTDILISNRETLLAGIAEWQRLMTHVTHWLAIGDEAAIYQFFDRAKDTRDRLPVHENGAIPAFHDLYIDVPDQPGVIAEVTGLLGEAGLSIINLKIQETREEIIGVLQVSFKTNHDLLKGKACIEAQTSYACRLK
ncbi:prephenate dehydrogenase [Enterococcus sp. PF1-24]|uniref:prephenate dehydrogenase n=1 Tax=unclassified Enterococcus TaxID=2608891 RepID=UPI00247474BF|nr:MULTISPECIES: prephenate dehydrogenase [unclassified Enterococcus]MDH6364183.1 prephenate dehydrogenase [Enterococcus sp. PFB1-1]MDH6401284.1 prephenate dehydrogenase [Enterococcus sp. PF1-24]